MTSRERDSFAKQYEDVGISVWLPEKSDIEHYCVDSKSLSQQLKIEQSKALSLIIRACDALDQIGASLRFNQKRKDIINKLLLYKDGAVPPIGADEARAELSERGIDSLYVGKQLLSKLAELAKEEGLSGMHDFGKRIADSLAPNFASDLRALFARL